MLFYKHLIVCFISGEVIKMETDIDDLRLLDDLEFLFEDDELRFGLENAVVEQETFRVEVLDETNGMLIPIFLYDLDRCLISSELL